MASLNEFQKRKFKHVFNTFYDENHDGVIEWADFQLDIEKLSKLLNWASDSPQRKKAESSLKAIWDELKKCADKDDNAQISMDEWLEMWATVIKDHQNLPAWITMYMEFMYSFSDGNGDDVIDVDEFTAVYKNYGIPEEECKQAFASVTNNGAIELSLAEYKKLWTEFFLTTDEKARGNALFGKIK